jgi:hypothetical protein
MLDLGDGYCDVRMGWPGGWAAERASGRAEKARAKPAKKAREPKAVTPGTHPFAHCQSITHRHSDAHASLWQPFNI